MLIKFFLLNWGKEKRHSNFPDDSSSGLINFRKEFGAENEPYDSKKRIAIGLQ